MIRRVLASQDAHGVGLRQVQIPLLAMQITAVELPISSDPASFAVGSPPSDMPTGVTRATPAGFPIASPNGPHFPLTADGCPLSVDGSVAAPRIDGPQEITKPRDLQSVEAVVENCTAPRPSHRLNWDYTLQSLRTGLPLAALDMTVATISLLLVGAVVNFSQGHLFNQGLFHQIPTWLFLQWGLMSLHQLYPGAGVAAVTELRGIARSTALTCLCLSSINMVFGQLPRIEFGIFVCSALMISIALPIARRIARTFLARTSWWGIRTLLIGSRGQCQQLCDSVGSHRESGLIMTGYVCDNAEYLSATDDDPKMLGASFDAQAIACEHHAPVAALASSDAESLLTRLVFQFPSLIWLDQSAVMQETSDPIGAFNRRLNVPFLRFTPRLLKRALDLAIVIPGLMALAIPMGVMALLIKFYSPGPIIYGSSRVGQHGRRFKMWKFRSMVPNGDEVLQARLASDPAARAEWDRDQKLKDDPRIIPGIGRIMRSCSLDELPQLWNVLVGQMSLVGPRPVPPAEIVKYQDHYYQYTNMWPGITGLWQVSGRNDTSFQTRVFLVHHYAANWSLWLDAWILVKTPMTVITRKGAY